MTPPRPAGAAQRLTVIVSEDATWHHRPVFTELVHRAHRSGLAGATVFRGVEGFGASQHIHTSRILSLSEELPVAVVVVDAAERVQAFLPELDGLVTGGIVLVEDVHVHVPRPGTAAGGA